METVLSNWRLFLLWYSYSCISETVLSSSIGNNIIQAGGIFIINNPTLLIILGILSMLPSIKDYSPIYLSSFLESQWITTRVEWNSAIKTIVSSIILSILLVFIGILSFNSQELE